MENLFISNSILISDNDKLLTIIHKLFYIFTEKGERRVCYHHITLFKIFNTFLTTEITIAIKFIDNNFFIINSTIAILIALIDKHNTLAISLIACGNKFLQTKKFKVQRKILKEIAFSCIVTITIHNLALEEILIVTHFLFNIGKHCVKLVIACFFRSMKIVVLCHNTIVFNYYLLKYTAHSVPNLLF